MACGFYCENVENPIYCVISLDPLIVIIRLEVKCQRSSRNSSFNNNVYISSIILLHKSSHEMR